jgi:hypothetical protein
MRSEITKKRLCATERVAKGYWRENSLYSDPLPPYQPSSIINQLPCKGLWEIGKSVVKKSTGLLYRRTLRTVLQAF